MESKVIDFNIAANFSFDPDKITILDGKMQLKNTFLRTFTQNFSSSAGFTFQPSRIEFVNDLMQQVDTGGGNYIGDVVTLPLFNDSTILQLDSFDAIDINLPHYTLNDMWFDGAAWVPSTNSFPQSNIASAVNFNILTFPPSDNLDVKVITATGTNQMAVDNLDIDYTVQTPFPTDKPFADFLPTIDMYQPLIFSPDSEEPATTELRYTLIIDGEFKNWDTVNNVWITTGGLEGDSNTKDQIQDNLPAIRVGSSQPKTFSFRTFFISTDGSATPRI